MHLEYISWQCLSSLHEMGVEASPRLVQAQAPAISAGLELAVCLRLRSASETAAAGSRDGSRLQQSVHWCENVLPVRALA